MGTEAREGMMRRLAHLPASLTRLQVHLLASIRVADMRRHMRLRLVRQATTHLATTGMLILCGDGNNTLITHIYSGYGGQGGEYGGYGGNDQGS